jgi:dolichol-phosphate mannosyltransferase
MEKEMSANSNNLATVDLVIPVKNEALSLSGLFAELERVIGELTHDVQFNVLISDDGSTDNSVQQIHSYTPQAFAITLCSFTRSFGKEAAITAGLERSSADCVIVLDGDLQHPPALIPQMLTAWQAGNKVVEALKANRGHESAIYRLFARLYYFCLRSMSDLDIENLSDYKLLDREVVQTFQRMPERNRFFRGMTEWLGYTKYQISFDVPDRPQGESSWSVARLLAYSVRSLSAVSSAPLQIVTVMGILMFVLSIVLGSIALYQWASGEAVTGFTTVILLLLLVGSLLMVSLGVIGLYIARIYDEIKHRPHYIVASESKTVPAEQKGRAEIQSLDSRRSNS